MRVDAAVVAARALGVDRLDALLLLSHVLERPRSWLIAHDDAQMGADAEQAYLEAVGRRAAGTPLAYLVGRREFHGLLLEVSPAVLVPRPETELLVDWALELLPEGAAATVADLGTGSGAVGIALARRRPHARVVATDLHADALDLARLNAARLAADMEFLQGDWWAALDRRRFDVVVSNPPYVAGDDPHLAALAHEPRHALTPGGDGLAALRAITSAAPDHLETGGWLLLEHGHEQGQAVRDLLSGAGLVDVRTRVDLAGLERCSGGRLPPVSAVGGTGRVNKSHAPTTGACTGRGFVA